jgi:dephospho-CoA kinase
MRLSDIAMYRAVQAGINDPNIFKAVFLAGGPGSGKSFIAKQAMGGQGLKFLNSDAAFEYLLNQRKLSFDIDPKNEEQYAQQMKARSRAKHMAALQKVGWVNGMLGLILDGTGKDFAKIKATREGLEAIGYDTGMIFVNTSKEVTLQRNRDRKRTVPESIVLKGWKAVQDNMGKFQTLFGGKNFFIVDNSEKLDAEGIRTLGVKLHRMSQKWLGTPLKNPVGQMTVKVLKSTGGKTLADIPQAVEEISKVASVRFASFIDHHLGEMDRAAAKTCSGEACQACQGCLKDAEKWVCSACKSEIKGFLGDDYYDPNGPQWYSQVMHRQPLVRTGPGTW